MAKIDSGHIRLQKNLRLKTAIARELGVSFEPIMAALRSLETEHGSQACVDEGRFLQSAKSIANSASHDKWDDLDGRVMDACRKADFTPRYFQYLSLIFVARNFELALDNSEDWLAILNENSVEPAFTQDDLRLTAFWMATSAGKTHLLHVCLQLLGPKWDRTLILTPSETLTEQHSRKLRALGRYDVFAYPMDGDARMLGDQLPGTVIIMDINKLSEAKTGDGVTLDVSLFEGGKNLVFVDEGHKGGATEEGKWKRLQRTLAGVGGVEKYRGLLVEFSATFGQIVDKGGSFDDYSKSIAFDYPYDRFVADNYGKQPVPKTASKGISPQAVLAASLVTYWKQWATWSSQVTQEQIRDARLNISPPLWVLLGLSVVGSKPKGTLNEGDKAQTTEVIETVRFLSDILCNEGENHLARLILEAQSAKLLELDEHSVAKQVLTDVFGFREGMTFVANTFRSCDKELGLGLVVGDKTNYFGVINVGEPGKLGDLLKPHGISVSVDAMEQGLFDRIEHAESGIRILIGSRRFAEGWDSYRPSTLTLLNLGQKEGSLIIQMFGRVVRFHGVSGDGKRLSSPSPELRPLQTAYIFGLKADYLTEFLTSLRSNGVEIEQKTFPVRSMIEADAPIQMVVAKTPSMQDFSVRLHEGDWLTGVSKINISLGGKVTQSSISEMTGSITSEKIKVGENITKEMQEAFSLVDIELLYSDLVDWRSTKGWWNLSFSRSAIVAALKSQKFEITGIPGVLNSADRVQSTATSIVRQLITKAYRKHEAKKVQYEYSPPSSGAPSEYWVRETIYAV